MAFLPGSLVLDSFTHSCLGFWFLSPLLIRFASTSVSNKHPIGLREWPIHPSQDLTLTWGIETPQFAKMPSDIFPKQHSSASIFSPYKKHTYEINVSFKFWLYFPVLLSFKKLCYCYLLSWFCSLQISMFWLSGVPFVVCLLLFLFHTTYNSRR